MSKLAFRGDGRGADTRPVHKKCQPIRGIGKLQTGRAVPVAGDLCPIPAAGIRSIPHRQHRLGRSQKIRSLSSKSSPSWCGSSGACHPPSPGRGGKWLWISTLRARCVSSGRKGSTPCDPGRKSGYELEFAVHHLSLARQMRPDGHPGLILNRQQKTCPARSWFAAINCQSPPSTPRFCCLPETGNESHEALSPPRSRPLPHPGGPHTSGLTGPPSSSTRLNSREDSQASPESLRNPIRRDMGPGRMMA